MGRVKIAMEPIQNDKKRKITFNTRKQGLVKKARELATLCDVDVSMIISTDDQETPQQIFPPDSDQLNRLIDLYKHCTNPVNRYVLLDFFMDRKNKMEEELVKAKKKNVEAKYPSWFDFLDSLPEARLREFALRLENKIFDVKNRIEYVKNRDRYPCYPGPVNFGFDPVGVGSNPIMQLSNCNSINPVMMPLVYPNSLLNMMLNEDDGVIYDGEISSLEPPSMEHCFPPELWQQLLMSSLPSHVNDTTANGNGVFDYFK
ncbi:putative transcription factor MADS-type1 family [Helianthus annuus]|uniref:Putative transcription factor, MADS-box n=1 Tax=Helianthus annuus TaxID=4232 RepID=A0A251U820_HELAN|nr:MADS-box transcription factor 2 [Helianthus annuus]KAF5795935.1 putative transcription factor MADS-type1 family [Helianthus annuus]KAJ0554039.1 putative transcription factor MADS-type1 family [Helianthus annuus]KAJ0719674.1 putative transcription factor MADS-type1 family [Helianthus annuus]KAJ0722902.1 putative transcription factor MADS-type1 family [Helianthus annuus]KAJ0898459.1 putative transcription factor MADS-type1 family [Helianthus annuus]